jgi:hypothetical protein
MGHSRQQVELVSAASWLFLLSRSPSRPGLSISHDFKEQVFQGGRWAANFDITATVPLDDRSNLFMGHRRKATGTNLRVVSDS